MKKITKILISVAVVLAIAVGAAGIHFGYAKKADKFEALIVETNGAPLRVGVVSDLQLPGGGGKDTHQYQSAVATFKMLKEKGMDALLIAGDFTDLSTKDAWASFEDAYNEVFAEGEEPIPLYIMGNHDYWLDYFVKCGEIATPAKQQKRFTKATGEYPLSHKSINGVHFIMWSSLDGSYDKCNNNEKWIRAEIEKAIEDDPTKPVFVVTHLNPTNTVYGSKDDWGNADIKRILDDYKQVISISAHSHFPIADERSIWQDTFTAFSTQTLDYTCINVEQNRFNSVSPLSDAYGNNISTKVPACLYMEITNDSVKIERLEANTGKTLAEPWVVEAPFGSEASLSKYTDDRAKSNEAPTLGANLNAEFKSITDTDGKMRKMIAFTAGDDDEFVHSYKIGFQDENHNTVEFDETAYNGDIFHYDADGNKMWSDNPNYDKGAPKKITEIISYSDFFLGAENMAERVELRVPNTVPDNVKYAVITAVDSWDAESAPVVCELS